MEQFCPICGKEADSPHHICPRSLGGTDEPRNIIWLCKHCHDAVEERQEQSGVELSPDLIEQMRRELKIKLDEEDGVSSSYLFRDGHYLLLWIMLPGKTKQWINQYVDGVPETETVVEKETLHTPSIRAAIKRGVGRPTIVEEVNTTYLEELINNRGLSYRKAKKQLQAEGFKISHEAIRKRIIHSSHYSPPLQAQCKYKLCRALFTPKGARQIYCSSECNLAARRHKKSKRELDTQ